MPLFCAKKCLIESVVPRYNIMLIYIRRNWTVITDVLTVFAADEGLFAKFGCLIEPLVSVARDTM